MFTIIYFLISTWFVMLIGNKVLEVWYGNDKENGDCNNS